MTTKEIKELALQILNRNGETGIKKSDFTFISGDDLEDLVVNNAYWNDDADRPLDMYYEIEPREK